MPKEHTSESTINESSGKYDNSTTGPKKTRILEDPEDTDTSSEGSKPNSKDHQARIKEKKESISSS